jgi:glycerol uptake facilitator protein
MNEYIGEFVGTAMLITLGHGINANMDLQKTKGSGTGWLMMTFGWGFTVALCIYAVGRVCEAHINPAVTIAMAATGHFDAALVPGYLLAQFAGAMLGATIMSIIYWHHFAATEDPAKVLGVFATGPAINKPFSNFLAEAAGTAILVFGILSIAENANFLVNENGEFATRSLLSVGINPLLIGLLVAVIGLGLGGPTGFAINPARDLGPRIIHAILPIPNKGPSNWAYAWVPVVGPIIGGICGALLFNVLNP